ncbi:MAG: hypothetical protein C0445_00550 [Polaromonas sp.]|nr:hypothetical protein [Polaromonas sp.]
MRQLPTDIADVRAAPEATSSEIAASGVSASSRWGGVGMSHVVSMSEQLLTLIEAGMPIDRALHVTADTLGSLQLRDVLRAVVVEIEKGKSFSEAISAYPRIFPKLYVSMVRAGERGGILPVVLARVIDYYAKSIEFRSFIITSSIYPVILLMFGLVSVIGLVIFVIPKFGEVFASMDRALPWSAAFLLDSSAWLRGHWLYLVGGFVVLCVGGVAVLSDAAMRFRFQSVLLSMPGIGFLIKKIQFSQICRTWGALLGAGVPILSAIQIVKSLTSWLPIEKALDDLSLKVQEGRAVSDAVNENPVFPKLVGQLVKVGEESGTLDFMLDRIAVQYEKDVQKMTKSIVAAFEPTMIIVVGALIGFVVVSMLMAVFSINDMPI